MSEPEEKPPLGGWSRLYALLVAELVLMIALCAAIASYRG